ncbi:hypothetical protein D3C76_1098410 [compost metagenome]
MGMVVKRTGPVTLSGNVMRSRKQQARRIALLDRRTQFGSQLRVQMRQHHRTDIAFSQPLLRQAVEQSRRMFLTAAGPSQRRQQGAGTGQHQDILAPLLHQQAPRGQVHQVVLVGLDPFSP